jgi:DNA polymerase III gamma/tau subunit
MSFHLQYRPANLSKVIGHEAAVTRLQGIISSGKSPNALAFFGPSGSGKTTLARAFAADINGVKGSGELRDYVEKNAAAEKTMEDVKSWLQIARFKPQFKRRVICIDEAQGLISNPQAANAFLKPLEEPPANTIWIICSMEPAKFQASETGRAILKRCNQFVLEEHSTKDLYKQGLRIAKAEEMKYVMGDDNAVIKDVAKSVQDMRSMSNVMESLQQYYEGIEGKKPKQLTVEHIQQVLRSTESSDDELAYKTMLAIYQQQFKVVMRCLLDVQDGFHFVTKLQWMNNAVMNNAVLDGARHRKNWSNNWGKLLIKDASKLKITLGVLAAVNATIVEARAQAATFQMSPEEMLSAKLYRLIKDLQK